MITPYEEKPYMLELDGIEYNTKLLVAIDTDKKRSPNRRELMKEALEHGGHWFLQCADHPSVDGKRPVQRRFIQLGPAEAADGLHMSCEALDQVVPKGCKRQARYRVSTVLAHTPTRHWIPCLPPKPKFRVVKSEPDLATLEETARILKLEDAVTSLRRELQTTRTSQQRLEQRVQELEERLTKPKQQQTSFLNRPKDV